MKQRFSPNHPIQTSFVAVVIAVVSLFLNFGLYVHACHASFD